MCLSDFEAFLAAKLAKPDPLPTDADKLAELEAWQRFALSRIGKANPRPFNPESTRGDLADFVQSALDNTESDAAPIEAIKGVFAQAREKVAYKAIQATRLDYESTIRGFMEEAVAGNLNRRRWTSLMNGENARFINKAYRDGLEDGGVGDEPDSDDLIAIRDLIDTARGHVTSLGEALFKEEKVTAAMADQKPDMWWNKSILPAYYDGFESAARNQMMEFGGDDGEESCNDCTRLKGQRHRLKDWKRKGLRPGVDTENFECGGWKCDHKLIPVQGKARGRW